MKEVYIFGAGGHTRSLISLLKNCDFNILGIYDDSFNQETKEIINSIALIGNLSSYSSNKNVILSYGDNDKRQKLFLQHVKDVCQQNIIHSTSIVDDNVEFGQSNFVFANSVINSNAKIGNNNIINTGSIIEHEVEIGSHNHISVGSIVCGRSKIGDNCFIGAGAVIIDKIKVCDNVTVGANSVVIKSIEEAGVYVGNPARKTT